MLFFYFFAQNMIHNKTMGKKFALRYSLYSVNYCYQWVFGITSPFQRLYVVQ